MTLDRAISLLYDLHPGTTKAEDGAPPHERPHKPLLLLAVLDLIDEGRTTPDRIPWCQELRDRFCCSVQLTSHLTPAAFTTHHPCSCRKIWLSSRMRRGWSGGTIIYQTSIL